MVEATSRGEVPPSTMIEMRSLKLFPHGFGRWCILDSPLRLAEVAVMGMPGSLHYGKRNG